jgi:phosphoribosylaminoimidazole-succinocarboxamide synthase
MRASSEDLFPLPADAPLLTTTLDALPLHARGKVRDIFDLGDQLLFVATDRISAFDHVLASGIPDKGRVLTQLSAFWFEQSPGRFAKSSYHSIPWANGSSRLQLMVLVWRRI